MKYYKLLFISLFLLLCTIPIAATAESVIGKGVSEISLRDAITKAQRLTVLKTVAALTQDEAHPDRYTLQTDKMVSKPADYITKFDLLSDSRDADGRYIVTIQAVVDRKKIQKELLAIRAALEEMDLPKLMVLIEEEYKGMDNLNMEIAATELSSLLLANSFTLVDKAQLETIQMHEIDRQSLFGDIDAAASLGLAFGCQYVVVGRAVVKDGGEAFAGSSLRSIQASLQLKIIQTQTGSIIGSVVKNGIAAHINPLTGATIALQETAQKATDEYLVDTITTSFRSFIDNGAPFKLIITGVDSFGTYKAVAKGVSAVTGIISSKKESWNSTGGLLILSLKYKGTSEDLATELDEMPVKNSSLMVVDFEPDRVNCRVK